VLDDAAPLAHLRRDITRAAPLRHASANEVSACPAPLSQASRLVRR
jgi:hypothetical protein